MNEEFATFTPRQFLRVLADESFGLKGSRLCELAGQYLRSNEVVLLGKERNGDKWYSTRQNFEREKELLARVDRLNQRPGRRVAPDVIRAELARGLDLSAEQQVAVRHLVEQGSGVAVLVGRPGTGKSRSLDAVRRIYERAGYAVLGCSTAARAAKELEASSGIHSTTIAKLIGIEGVYQGDLEERTAFDHAKTQATGLLRAATGKPVWKKERYELNDRTVLVVDEAGMVGTKSLNKILLYAEKAGARVLLSGDPAQLQPVKEAGSPLQHLVKRCGAATLSTIIRQADLEDRKAIELYAKGQIDAALASFHRRGKCVVTKDRASSVSELVDAWAQAGGLTKPEDCLIFARTRKEVAELNARTQRARLAAGELGPGLPLGKTFFHRFDRVLFTANDKRLGVTNGTLGTVLAINPVTLKLTVKLDSGGRAVVPLREYQNLDLGYSLTTHRGQGMSVSKSFVLASEFNTRELSFVQLSRHKTDLRLFVHEDLAGVKLAELAKAMQRSEAKVLAHERQQSLTR
jgi:ATP-dependent exoDNAse (exonuclease V) alpha subunit